MVIIPEDDIINAMDHNDYGVTEFYGQAIEWILRDQAKIIEEFKKSLPKKAAKNRKGWPKFIWFEASLHTMYDNYNLRLKFNKCLEKVSGFNKTIEVLKMSELWQERDTSLIQWQTKKMTPHGWRTYWAAIDESIEAYEKSPRDPNASARFSRKQTFTNKNQKKPREDKSFHRKTSWNEWHQRPRHFKNYQHNPRNREDNRRRLPTPP